LNQVFSTLSNGSSKLKIGFKKVDQVPRKKNFLSIAFINYKNTKEVLNVVTFSLH